MIVEWNSLECGAVREGPESVEYLLAVVEGRGGQLADGEEREVREVHPLVRDEV